MAVLPNRLSSRQVSLIVLLVIVGVALYLRIALPYDEVFVDGPVRFRGADTHYYMRHIEYTALHYPEILSFDPYRIFPGGGGGPTTRPFFVLLMAGVAWMIGLGSPSIDTITSWVPTCHRFWGRSRWSRRICLERSCLTGR